MTNTETYNEADHNRDAAKRYAPKEQGAPETTLTEPKPRGIGELGGYVIKGYKRIAIARHFQDKFAASVYRDGKRVLTISHTGGKDLPPVLTNTTTGRAYNADEVAEFQAVCRTAFPDQPYADTDLFLETGTTVAMLDTLTVENGWNRAEAVEHWIERDRRMQVQMSLRQKEILRNPAIVE